MHFFEYFCIKTLKYDLANKFFYSNTKKLPKLKKIILNFGCKTTGIKNLATSLLALELITNQKGILTTTKHSNILLKIRKGNPAGCKVTLRKRHMFNFLARTLIEIFPKVKDFTGVALGKKIKKNIFSYELHETFSFNELEEHYYLFNNLPKLDITIVTNSKVKEELIFILKSLQFPFRQKNR
jgi:large subunit ribosomal protein L5